MSTFNHPLYFWPKSADIINDMSAGAPSLRNSIPGPSNTITASAASVASTQQSQEVSKTLEKTKTPTRYERYDKLLIIDTIF
jgi:hypothetical protein